MNTIKVCWVPFPVVLTNPKTRADDGVVKLAVWELDSDIVTMVVETVMVFSSLGAKTYTPVAIAKTNTITIAGAIVDNLISFRISLYTARISVAAD